MSTFYRVLDAPQSPLPTADGRVLRRLWKLEFTDPDFFFVGGLFTHSKKAGPKALAGTSDFKGLSLLETHTHTRVPVHRADGEDFVAACYVNVPLVYAARGNDGVGFSFSPLLQEANAVHPLFLSLTPQGDTFHFTLATLDPYDVLTKTPASFASWTKGGWQPLEQRHPPRPRRLEIKKWEGAAGPVLRGLFQTLKPAAPLDLPFHLGKVRRHLMTIWEPREGLWASSNSRFETRTPHLSVLPLFDTLTAGARRLAALIDDDGLQAMSERTKKFTLSPAASVLTPQGRVWHNRVRFQKSLVFDSIYNTGIGGFPGGQATLLRTLFQLVLDGDKDDRLLRTAVEGARWLLNVQEREGQWARSYRVPGLTYSGPESDTGADSFSPGATAEGALALWKAGQATGNDAFKNGARRALDFVNRWSDPWPLGFGYLRDNRLKEPEGLSAVFAVHANVALGETASAERWGEHLLTWIRLWQTPGVAGDGAMDPLAYSFKPRVSSYETALAAEAFLTLYDATQDAFWLDTAQFVFNAVNLENEFPGYSEGLYFTLDATWRSLHFESRYAASAVLDYLLKWCTLKGIQRVDIPKPAVESAICIANTLPRRLKTAVASLWPKESN